VSSDGRPGRGGSYTGSGPLSADGRWVAFFSLAPNLVPSDGNDTYDVFVRDRGTAATELVSAARSLQLTAGPVRLSPAGPRAGGSFTTAVRVTREGQRLPNAQVRCLAKLRGRTLTVTTRAFLRSTARCAWRVPRTAARAMLSGSITAVTADGQVSRSFAVRVR
jgi:hypothetical protein